MGPGCGFECPCAFQAAGDRVGAMAGAEPVPPPESLGLDLVSLWLDTDVLGGISSAMGLAEGVTTGNQGHRLFVIHPHAPESLAYRVRGRLWVRLPARTLGIHVDQAHLRRAERMIQFSVLIASIGGEPLAFRPPVHFFGLPGIDTATSETQGFEAHRVHGDRAREDHQIGPGNLAAVLLLDRPEQPVRLVQVCVVWPTVERREALQTPVRAAPAVDGSIGAGAVPGHTDEKRPVVTKVRRPPVLGSRHQLFEIGRQRMQIEAFELLRIVEVFAKGIRSR